MDIIELLLDEENEYSGIDAISVVENPAIESDFIALKSQEIKFAEVNKEQKILMGAALIPNKPIYRKSGEKEYYVYFSPETVKKASELYLIKGNQSNATLEHKEKVQDLTIVESWIVEDVKMDKSARYNFEGIQKGTWMVSMKVNNAEIWNDFVKTGKVKGFSIEGYFADKAERPKESVEENMEAQDQLEKIVELLESNKEVFATHKVELNFVNRAKAAIQDLKKIDKLRRDSEQSASDAIKVLEGLQGKLMGARRDLAYVVNNQRLFAGAEQFIKNGKKILKEMEVAAKELGVAPNKIKEYANLDNEIGLAEFDLDRLKKVIDFVKKEQKRLD